MSDALYDSWLIAQQFMHDEAQKLEVGKLDHLSRRLLDWIYLRCGEGHPLYMLEVMTESGLASLATTRRSLRKLIDLKLIELTAKGDPDGRRAIKLTETAAEELDVLGAAFREWMKRGLG